MKALEALVTLEAIDTTVAKVKKEVANPWEEVAIEGAEQATMRVANVETTRVAKVVEVLEEEEAGRH